MSRLDEIRGRIAALDALDPEDWLRLGRQQPHYDFETHASSDVRFLLAVAEAAAEVRESLLSTLDEAHPLEYGFRDDHAVVGYDPDDATVVERLARCHNCEQWPPCDVRSSLAALDLLLNGEGE